LLHLKLFLTHLLLLTLLSSAGGIAEAAPTPHLSPYQIRAWTHVAWCEAYKTRAGGIDWHYRGQIYSGALGIRDDVWRQYAPRGYPASAASATPREQIYVASLIDKGFPVPDQNGNCDNGQGW
jgi:Transglycosylase-like domain